MNKLQKLIENLSEEEKYALTEILAELEKAKAKHSHWPDDLLHAVAIVNEESGELTRACLQRVYEGGKFEEVVKESKQVGAMAIRFMSNPYLTINRHRDTLV